MSPIRRSCIVLAVFLYTTLAVSLPVHRAHADDSSSDDQSSETQQETTKKKSDSSTAAADAQNNRMQSLAGSASRWSGQFNFTYTGPPVSAPFSATAPNPLDQIPEPLVNLQGTVSVRYRIDAETSISFGTGVEVFTPFNGANGWSVADPYINYNRLFKLGPFHSYLVVGPTLWTDNQYYTQDGYRFGLNITDETYYVFKFGLTAGLDLWVGGNTFASGANYDPGQQDVWFIGGGPYVEYAFAKAWSLRSVLGIQGDHSSSTPGGAIVWENPYQTLGVGVQIFKPWYLYVYVIASPYSGHFTTSNTGLGFNTIINLF